MMILWLVLFNYFFFWGGVVFFGGGGEGGCGFLVVSLLFLV